MVKMVAITLRFIINWVEKLRQLENWIHLTGCWIAMMPFSRGVLRQKVIMGTCLAGCLALAISVSQIHTQSFPVLPQGACKVPSS